MSAITGHTRVSKRFSAVVAKPRIRRAEIRVKNKESTHEKYCRDCTARDKTAVYIIMIMIKKTM